jgi:hypothetical protein
MCNDGFASFQGLGVETKAHESTLDFTKSLVVSNQGGMSLS